LLGYELLLGVGLIGADAENFDSTFLSLGLCVPETAGLGGASRGVGLGIKEDEEISL
jgi:hypothetical protein